MHYANATDQVELPYGKLFPPKSTAIAKKKHPAPLQQHYFATTDYDSPTFVLPLTHNGPHVPQCIEEAGQVYLNNLHVSLANYQLIEERSKRLSWWQYQKGKKQGIEEEHSVVERIYVRKNAS